MTTPAKEIIYRKVYIRSEDDLPKEDEYYFFHVKHEPIIRLIFYCPKNHDMILLPQYYVDTYDWYLLPVELPTEEEIIDAVDDYGEKHQEDKYGYSIYGITSNAYSQGIKWLLNKILGK